MNRNKLIDIILKDIEELKDISVEIKNDWDNSEMETHIAYTKASLIVQELQLLKERYGSKGKRNHEEALAQKPETEERREETSCGYDERVEIKDEENTIDDEDKTNDSENLYEEKDPPSGLEEEQAVRKEGECQEEENSAIVEEEGTILPGSMVDDREQESDAELEDEQGGDDEYSTPGNEALAENELEDRDEEEPSEFGEDETQAKKTIGENFRSQMSINDRLGNSGDTLETKIAHSPITSLNTSIGLNDRFLFIREIFNNDAETYANAIREIDNCEKLQDAVDFLSSNFKIKKNEASLRFVELIKRRFSK